MAIVMEKKWGNAVAWMDDSSLECSEEEMRQRRAEVSAAAHAIVRNPKARAALRELYTRMDKSVTVQDLRG